MSETAIEISGITKKFRRYKQKPTSMKARITRRGIEAEEFLALDDVSYVIHPGTTVGLIGPNGSGKITLLKIIAGVLRPTAGTITSHGRIAALLELGAGFHQELTGRENVYLNASILGLGRKGTDAVFDDIVAFAELEDFIDTQVKFYSSGMFVRLGFAVAVHVDPEILLIDEVLAVGDEGFQQKGLARINRFKDDGRTIVFVTHVVNQVRQICTDSVMLLKGKVHASGDPQEVVAEYRRQLLQKDVAYAVGRGNKDVEIVGTEVLDTSGSPSKVFHPGDGLTVQVDLKANATVVDPVVDVIFHDHHDVYEFGANSDDLGANMGTLSGAKRLRFRLAYLPYTSGKYWISVAVRSKDGATVYEMQEARLSFEVPRTQTHPPVAYIPVHLEMEDL